MSHENDRRDPEFDLRTESPQGRERIRTLGILAFAAATSPINPMGLDESLFAAIDDEKKIRELLQTWEELHPEDAPGRWQELAVDPYVALGASMVVVDEKRHSEWIEGEIYQEVKEKTPPKRPRDVRLSKFQVTFIGNSKAIAIYRLEESLANGQTTAGNVAAVVARQSGSWKVAIVVK